MVPASIWGQGALIALAATVGFVSIGLLLAGMILFAKKKLVKSELCQIRINEEEKRTLLVAGGQTLLSALTNEGIPVPSPCGGKATCKQCRLQVVQGAGDPLETDLATFSKRELKEGWRLSCQFKVKQDLDVHVEERYLEVKEWEGRVVSNENVATYIKELIIELPKGTRVPYRSGGYMQIVVPPFKANTSDWKETIDAKFHADWHRYQLFDRTLDFSHLRKDEVIRAYSFASYPAEAELLKFNIRIATPPFIKGAMAENMPWGICSSYTFNLKKGDKVRMTGPYGESFMIEDERPLIFLIGGAGSSFGRSHVMHLLKTERSRREIDFWYGARSIKENIYQEEYELLDVEFPNFRYHLVLSEPLEEDIRAGWPVSDPVKTGFLFAAFKKGQLDQMEEPEECLYYVCGPPLHNSSCLKLLDDYGVDRSNIVLDDFGS